MRPVLFVTGRLGAERVGAIERLHEAEQIELALFGGRSRHGPPGSPAAPAELRVPVRRVEERALYTLAASGRHRAVIVSSGGRVALPATWLGARRAGLPIVLWASLWSHPRTPAHLLSRPLLMRMYRSADAVVTYGPHVSAYVARHGARNITVAPQAVENAFWRAPAAAPAHPQWPAGASVRVLFAGRADAEKGLAVLLEAWRLVASVEPTHPRPSERPAAALVLAGVDRAALEALGLADGAGRQAGYEVAALGAVEPVELRNIYASVDLLVVPSVRTRDFREPWGLVVNEAFNRGVPVIASDEVGAVDGGLVRDGHNGLVVRAGDPEALAAAMKRLIADRALRERLGAAGAADVQAYTPEAWAEGFSAALRSLGVSAADEPQRGPGRSGAGTVS